MLPHFTSMGLLPAGDYELTLGQLRRSSLVASSEQAHPHWDSGWRFQLVDNLEVLARQLWEVGVEMERLEGSSSSFEETAHDSK